MVHGAIVRGPGLDVLRCDDGLLGVVNDVGRVRGGSCGNQGEGQNGGEGDAVRQIAGRQALLIDAGDTVQTTARRIAAAFHLDRAS